MHPLVCAMFTAFAQLGVGFEAKRPLGPILGELRQDHWEEWAQVVDEEGVDIDAVDAEGEVRWSRRLLRRGFHPDPRLNLFTATGYLAHELFRSELSRLAPAEAIDELMRWAEANEALQHGKRTALLGQLRAIWNDELQPVAPTQTLVRLVVGTFPPANEGPAAAQRLVTLRRGALRLLCRLGAQVASWGDEVIELPTAWFRAAKDPADITSIIGVSTATYQRLLVQPLIGAGILTLVEEGSRLEHTCTRYRLTLDVEGEPLRWAEAEAALAV
ncbi:MAG TPA: hypothetical protein VGK53_09445 [Propionicimonas sp.]